jgi:hypothetical protein
VAIAGLFVVLRIPLLSPEAQPFAAAALTAFLATVATA